MVARVTTLDCGEPTPCTYDGTWPAPGSVMKYFGGPSELVDACPNLYSTVCPGLRARSGSGRPLAAEPPCRCSRAGRRCRAHSATALIRGSAQQALNPAPSDVIAPSEWPAIPIRPGSIRPVSGPPVAFDAARTRSMRNATSRVCSGTSVIVAPPAASPWTGGSPGRPRRSRPTRGPAAWSRRAARIRSRRGRTPRAATARTAAWRRPSTSRTRACRAPDTASSVGNVRSGFSGAVPFFCVLRLWSTYVTCKRADGIGAGRRDLGRLRPDVQLGRRRPPEPCVGRRNTAATPSWRLPADVPCLSACSAHPPPTSSTTRTRADAGDVDGRSELVTPRGYEGRRSECDRARLRRSARPDATAPSVVASAHDPRRRSRPPRSSRAPSPRTTEPPATTT